MRRLLLLFAILALGGAAAWERGDAYVLRAGRTDVTRSSSSVRELVALRKRLAGVPAYLWVRLGPREYLIRDAAVLREAVALWAPIDALQPEQDAVGEEQRRLDRRIDAIEDQAAVPAAGELEALRGRNEVVSRRERELDDQEEALERVAEANLRALVDAAIRAGRAEALR